MRSDETGLACTLCSGTENDLLNKAGLSCDPHFASLFACVAKMEPVLINPMTLVLCAAILPLKILLIRSYSKNSINRRAADRLFIAHFAHGLQSRVQTI